MRKNKKILNGFFWILVLSGLLLGAAVFSLSVGAAAIPLKNVFSLLLGKGDSVQQSILLDIRLPRIVLGLAIGGALSLAGVLLQGMFRNPLVEPYTLVISGGAAVGVCFNLVLGLSRTLGSLTLPLCGFLGAGLVILLVYSLSTRRGILHIQGLLLTGVMLSFISSSLIMLIMALARTEDLHGIIFWIMGSLEESDWRLIQAALGTAGLGLAGSYLFCFDLNALSLGEEEAVHLGINVEKTKRLLFIIASLLTGVSVAIAGMIGFVGLVVPHFMRLLVGSDHRILLGSSFLAGAAFLIFCDTAARTIIAPLELPVGVITGIIGGSLFVYALVKKQVFAGGK
ncbi:MAG: iron ABC transporter permease [Candidatus Omnitrophota bacterium]